MENPLFHQTSRGVDRSGKKRAHTPINSTLNRPLALLKQLLHAVFFVPVTLTLLFEEWGWEPLSRLFAARLARLRLRASTEGKISRMPPWAAALTFASGLRIRKIKRVKPVAGK